MPNVVGGECALFLFGDCCQVTSVKMKNDEWHLTLPGLDLLLLLFNHPLYAFERTALWPAMGRNLDGKKLMGG